MTRSDRHLRRAVRRAAAPVIETLERRSLLSAGELDPTFGVGGMVVNFNGDEPKSEYIDLAVQRDGKILVLTPDGDRLGQAVVHRFNRDGSDDSSFGVNGTAVMGTAEDAISAYAMYLQPDGKIVALGQDFTNEPYELTFVRFNPNGSPDTTFGDGGIAVTRFQDRAMDWSSLKLAAQPDGKFIVAGGLSSLKS